VRGIWTNITPAFANSTNSPGPRAGAAIAFDNVSQVNAVVMFGGQDSSGYLGDTWLFDKGKWTPEQTQSAPSARSGASLAFNGVALPGYLVLFGGLSDGKALGDTWEFSNKKIWTQITPTKGSPSPRWSASFVYDATDGYLLLFGGVDGTSVLDDTWTFGGGTWRELSPTISPSPAFSAGFASDTNDGLVLLFSGAASDSIAQNATWAFLDGNWTSLASGPNASWTGPAPPPPPSSTSRGSSDIVLLVIVVVVIAVAAVVGLLLLRRRRGKNLPPAPPKPFVPPASMTPPPTNDPPGPPPGAAN
jgi:hypothetical protein